MYYLFDDLIIIKNLDANNVKINEKLYKNISAYCTGFETGTRVQYLQVFINLKKVRILRSTMSIGIQNQFKKNACTKYGQLLNKSKDTIRSTNNRNDNKQ